MTSNTRTQLAIERNVTNCMGYEPSAIRVIDQVRDTELGLQIHLGGMEARTAPTREAREEIHEQVHSRVKLLWKLREVGHESLLRTPEEIATALNSLTIYVKPAPHLRSSAQSMLEGGDYQQLLKEQYKQRYQPM